MAYPADVSNRSRPMSAEDRKVILASSVGTIFEWYDFYLYGSLATVIGAVLCRLSGSHAQRLCAAGFCPSSPRPSRCNKATSTPGCGTR